MDDKKDAKKKKKSSTSFSPAFIDPTQWDLILTATQDLSVNSIGKIINVFFCFFVFFVGLKCINLFVILDGI